MISFNKYISTDTRVKHEIYNFVLLKVLKVSFSFVWLFFPMSRLTSHARPQGPTMVLQSGSTLCERESEEEIYRNKRHKLGEIILKFKILNK